MRALIFSPAGVRNAWTVWTIFEQCSLTAVIAKNRGLVRRTTGAVNRGDSAGPGEGPTTANRGALPANFDLRSDFGGRFPLNPLAILSGSRMVLVVIGRHFFSRWSFWNSCRRLVARELLLTYSARTPNRSRMTGSGAPRRGSRLLARIASRRPGPGVLPHPLGPFWTLKAERLDQPARLVLPDGNPSVAGRVS